MSIGQTFRTERTHRRMTVLQAAEATRIKPTQIEAMENDDFSSISAPIYAKGFIKLYSELLGLDPEPLIREYMERCASGVPTPKLSKDVPLKPLRKEIDPAIVDHSRFVPEQPVAPLSSGDTVASLPPATPRIPSEPVRDREDRRTSPWVGFVVILIVAGGAFGVYKACRPATRSAGADASVAVGAATSVPAAAGVSGRSTGKMIGELIEMPPLPYLPDTALTGAAPATAVPP